MNHPLNRHVSLDGRKVISSVAIVAALLLVIGGAWRLVAADSRSSTTHSVAGVTAPFAHSTAGGRDSYADVVKVVAPAVVTIRTEGKASESPTQFQTPNDDFFRRFFGDPKDAHGMVVDDVKPEGRAAAAGLRSGDVIEQVNRQPVQSVDALRAAMKQAGNKPTLLLINREGHDLFMAVGPANS